MIDCVLFEIAVKFLIAKSVSIYNVNCSGVRVFVSSFEEGVGDGAASLVAVDVFVPSDFESGLVVAVTFRLLHPSKPSGLIFGLSHFYMSSISLKLSVLVARNALSSKVS